MAVNWRVQGNLKAITVDIKKKRPKATVYSVGDASHQSRASDHNPYNWGYGVVVSAIDVMIRGGFTKADGDAIVKELRGRSDIQYLIWDGHIYSASFGWKKRKYNGKDPHTDHVHISAKHTSKADKDLRGLPKFLGKTVVSKPVKKPVVDKVKSSTLRRGDKGADVKTLQAKLGVKVDGDYGILTMNAVERFQRARKLTVDGVAGPKTLKALGLK